MTTLLINGRVHSPVAPDATAIAFSDGPDGAVVWLGTDDTARSEFPDADLIDLAGAFVAPAFVDSHVHLTATGLSLTGLTLADATSREHCLALLAAHARAHPKGIVWGSGWDESTWPDRTPPSTADIDGALGGRPAYLSRVDVHCAAASTALRAAAPGIAEATGFHPQRPLTAEAHHGVRAAARELLSADQRRTAQFAALDAAAGYGIVAVHECGGPDIGGLDDWHALHALEHGVQVTGYWGEAVQSAAQARALLAQTGAAGLAGDLFVDGALGSRTAWLNAPYTDAGHTCGTSYLDTEAIAAHLFACTEAGITAGFHVIGDAAVSAVTDALRRVVDHFGGPAVARCGHRLEHLEMVTPEQAASLGSWGVIGSVQPNFDAYWGGPDGMYAQRLGVDRAALLNPFALLASQGVPLAFGSDSPVTGLNPWATVRAATHHRTPGSGVSARAAFAAATRGAWRAGGVRDGVTGTLVPGAPASYAVWEAGALEVSTPADDAVQRWSTDPRSRVPALPQLTGAAEFPRCLRTVHRGKVVHG